MRATSLAAQRTRAALRVALSHYVANGVMVALGLLLIAIGVHIGLGSLASSSAATGAIVASPPDQVWPRRGKLLQMLPAPMLAVPLFLVIQLLHGDVWSLGLVLVLLTFLVFLGMAWGKRGIPIAIAVMLSMVFSMATHKPVDLHEALTRTLNFGLGASLYVVWAVLANLVLNARYRVLVVADVLLSLAALIRTEASQFTGADESDDRRETPPPAQGTLLRLQAALADQLQSTRDIVLESPRTPRRQQLAGMLVTVIEMRDHLLASELDLDALKSHPVHAEALGEMRHVLEGLADDLDDLADALMLMRVPTPITNRRPALMAIHPHEDDPGHNQATMGPSLAMLARGLSSRIGHVNDELLQLSALARGERLPDLAVVRANWQMFVSPTDWSLRPFFTVWRWDAPPLRHAIRAALAIAVGYLIAALLPWGSHEYWILLTIVVVLRGSLAQTLERRNNRVAGTMLGCVFAVALLSTHPSLLILLLVITVAMAASQAFAVRRYVITAVAASIVGLLQAHVLYAGASPTFAFFERISDTLIGAAVAWAFCYVLPSWERTQIPALVARTLNAQARHARLALGLGQLQSVDTSPELEWRLARREAFDSLSALVQATQRSLSEPRAVQPPLDPLERLQAHSYQLLAQLSAVKSMLVLRRDRLTPGQVEGPLERAATHIEAAIGTAPTTGPLQPESPEATMLAGPTIALPDPFDNDVSPWLLRRLDFAVGLATQLRDDASRILQSLKEASPPET